MATFHRNRQGVLLISLIIALGIMGIIAATVMLSSRDFTPRAQLRALQVDAQTVQTAVELYLSEEAAYPTDNGALDPAGKAVDFGKLVPSYIRQMPNSEVRNEDSGWHESARVLFVLDNFGGVQPRYPAADQNAYYNFDVTVGGSNITVTKGANAKGDLGRFEKAVVYDSNGLKLGEGDFDGSTISNIVDSQGNSVNLNDVAFVALKDADFGGLETELVAR